jgi:hypothetical protein
MTNREQSEFSGDGGRISIREFPRPPLALGALRKSPPTWFAAVFEYNPEDEATIRTRWGYVPPYRLPDVLMKTSKCEGQVICEFGLFYECLAWLEGDTHVVSYRQPLEAILLNFDGVEYYIKMDIIADCRNGERWLINLIDDATAEICKANPLLLESIEIHCESEGYLYFPLRAENLPNLAAIRSRL